MESKVKILNADNPQPEILSFQFTCIVGPKSSGKSYTSMKIYKQFLDQTKDDKYDFLNPFEITESRFTHQIYISPTADIDLTLRHDKYFGQFTLLKPEKINETCEYIMTMQKEYNDAQVFLDELFMFQPENYKGISQVRMMSILSKLIQLAEYMKSKYPQLRRRVTGQLAQKLDQLYKASGVNFDGHMFQRPKIYLILDDIGSEKQVSGSQVDNPLFSLAKGARHYSVYSAVYIAHSLSLLYGQLKGQFNCFILKKSLNQQHIKDLFNDYLSLRSKKFDWKDFDQLYENTTTEENNKQGYNSLYILTMPYSQIFVDNGKEWQKIGK